MRRTGVRCAAAVLAAGLTLSVCAAQEPDSDYHSLPPATSNSWFSGWFGGGSRGGGPAFKPAQRKPKTEAEAQATPPQVVDAVRVDREREEAALWRRLAVVDRLMQVADQNSDEALHRQADELSARIWDVYKQRTAHAGGPTADEAALDRRLGNAGKPAALSGSGGVGAEGRAANTRGDRP